MSPVILSVMLAVLEMLKTTNLSWQANPDSPEHSALNAKPTE